MKAASYLRVSTDAQTEHGLGLDVQGQAIRAWARQHGHKIASWRANEGISGSNGLDLQSACP
jgi:DNA invertase Pin-like site-specific DNA recombinase